MTAETSITDLVTAYKTNYETELNQDVPAQLRAFLNVLSTQEAICHKSLDKRIAAAEKSVFAVRAGAEGLAIIAQEFGVPRTSATKYVAACSVAASGGSSVAAGAQLMSQANGAYYTVVSNATEAGGFIVFSVTAEDAGEDPNLEPAVDALDFTSRPAGVNAMTEITTVTTYGANEEDLEVWRARVLEAERAAYGGGNTADYRYWGKQVALVRQIYPYSGKPVIWEFVGDTVAFVSAGNYILISATESELDTLGTIGVGMMMEISGSTLNDGFYTVQQSYRFSTTLLMVTFVETIIDEISGDMVTVRNQSLPGDRTVFVEKDAANPIPDASMLTLVREAINYGLDGTYQPALGDIDSTLYVEPVSQTDVFVEVLNLVCDAGVIDQCKARVLDDLEEYFAACRPYISGLDFEMDRRDIITDLTVGKVVQGVLDSYGASSDGVRISFSTVGSDTITSYQLNQGEIPHLALVYSSDDADWSV